MRDKVIRIIGLVNGPATAFDGEYVIEYDPSRDGVEPGTGRPMNCHLVTTADQEKATRYDMVEALELYRAVDPRDPVRPDGKPNRPLTAFTIEAHRADQESVFSQEG